MTYLPEKYYEGGWATYIMISFLCVYYFNFKMAKYIIGYFSILQICKLIHDFDRFKLPWLGLHLTFIFYLL